VLSRSLVRTGRGIPLGKSINRVYVVHKPMACGAMVLLKDPAKTLTALDSLAVADGVIY
jgi:predicted transcriptional regulator